MRSWCIAAGSSPEEALRGEGPGERGRQKEGTARFSLSPYLLGGKTYYLLTQALGVFMGSVKYSGLLLVPLIKRVHAASGTGVLGHCRVKSPKHLVCHFVPAFERNLIESLARESLLGSTLAIREP
ncbi:hypothetical protein Salat_2965300 [Sesamum alatum]|uniref:Uncharacterized protein n=1 Tax=Sesamum alatum TaxID=300844 RepID=A0AAE1XHM3_9LAMI|nr:hypothetical protein Salat_2971700 [Sesamum alatum]KAK4412240.1 hypothetical protein Salat_2965300 [Sesamum alatum]